MVNILRVTFFKIILKIAVHCIPTIQFIALAQYAIADRSVLMPACAPSHAFLANADCHIHCFIKALNAT